MPEDELLEEADDILAVSQELPRPYIQIKSKFFGSDEADEWELSDSVPSGSEFIRLASVVKGLAERLIALEQKINEEQRG